MQYIPTQEQLNVVKLALIPGRHKVKISAFAGGTKTTSLKLSALQIMQSLPGERILYACYNRSIAKESQSQFPSNTECKTMHSIAWGAVVARSNGYKNKLGGRLNGGYVSRLLSIPHEYMAPFSPSQFGNLVLLMVRNFQNSADYQILESHLPSKSIEELSLKIKKDVPEYMNNNIWYYSDQLVRKMFDENDPTPIEHDTYLKLYHLSNPSLAKYSIIFLDETQDSNPVILAILSGSKAKQIFVGDEHQAIYGWRGAQNAMQSLVTEHEALLTKSFRYGPKIADLATRLLRQEKGVMTKIVGNEKISDTIGEVKNPHCIIFRSNAGLLEAALAFVTDGVNISINGDISELVRLVEGIWDLELKGYTKHPELMDFASFADFVEFSETELGSGYAPIIKTTKEFGYKKVIELLNKVANVDEKDAETVLTTAHKSKGREWESVQIAGDWKSLDNYTEKLMTNPREAKINVEEINLLYVAITRASKALDVQRISYFDYLNRKRKSELEPSPTSKDLINIQAM